MRKFISIAALAALSLAWSDAALAGKKSEPASDSGAASASMYAMEDTGVADIDAFFDKAEAPLTTLANARASIDAVSTNLTSALGLKDGTPLKDALADLKAKGGANLTMAMDGAMPKLAVADAAPENVKNAVESTNKSLAAASAAVAGLSALPEQFSALITEAKSFADPAKLKGMVSNPTQLPKATSKITKNIGTLSKAKDEPEALKASVTGLVSDFTAAFK